MDRRKFLKTSLLGAAGAVLSPYILPSGSLFAATNSRLVNHVVFCLFAGGIRNIESVHQAQGNLMPAMLRGTPSSLTGLVTLPASPLSQPLQNYGTLFEEFRYAAGPTGHINGHTVALTGAYTDTGLNLRQNPTSPTVFEYYRKHNSPSQTALNAWWVANQLGAYPSLNYSSHPDYGPAFGANHISPTSIFNDAGVRYIGNQKNFNGSETQALSGIRNYLDNNFSTNAVVNGLGVKNTPDEAERIRIFYQQLINNIVSGSFGNPLGLTGNNASNDVYTIAITEEILKEFKPELLVVNMTDVDICHQNYTNYCANLQKADFAVAHLWNFIQSTPGLANDTILIVAPEHGRNLDNNGIADTYGRYAIDHTGDNTSREIFCMVVGPPGIVRQNVTVGTASSPLGQSIDIVPTIANILGFSPPSSLLAGQKLEAAFV
jgi:hypothetical protein